MDKIIQRQILETIRDNGGQASTGYLGQQLKSAVLCRTKTGVDPASHNFALLLDQKKIEYANPEKVSVRLTQLGWQEFDARYKKIWRFFNNDMAKMLSIIAIIVSILVGLKQLGWI